MNTAAAALVLGGAVVFGEQFAGGRRAPGVRVEAYKSDAYRAAVAFADGKVIDGIRVPRAKGELVATWIGQRGGCLEKYGEAQHQGKTVPARMPVRKLRLFTSFWLELFRAGRAADTGDVWEVGALGYAPLAYFTADELAERKRALDSFDTLKDTDLAAAYWAVWALHHGELAELDYTGHADDVALDRTRRVWSALTQLVVELDATGNNAMGKSEEKSWSNPGDLLDAAAYSGGAVVDAVGGAAASVGKTVALGALNLAADIATSPVGAAALLAYIAWKGLP